MAGAALRGFGKVLAKHLRKAPVLGGRVRGTPTKAGLVARRAALRGETTAQKYKKALGPTPKGEKAPKIPSIKKTAKETGKGALYITAGYFGAKKSASDAKKRHEAKKEKLTKSVEEHKKKTKEQKEKVKG